MKIGILTLPLHTNYGGILQAYALQTVLERMGHEVILFNKERRPLPNRFILSLKIIKRGLQKYILRKNINILKEIREHNAYMVLSKNTQVFIDKYIHSVMCNSLDEFKGNKLNLDAIIVGSDQIWRPLNIGYTLRESVDNAYLAFAKDWNITRLAYAASFGTNTWEYSEEQTVIAKNLISLFDGVSVREKGGVKLCKDKLNIDAIHVLDPTLLLDAETYRGLLQCPINLNKKSNSLMAYVLDHNAEIDKLIQSIAEAKQLEVNRFTVGIQSNGSKVQPSVEDWIASIYNADFVVTDSFHACVFSIIFHKPFIVIGNSGRGLERFNSLIDTFGLQKNLITRASEYSTSIDYTPGEQVYETLDTLKELSLKYLTTNLA